MNVFNAYKPLRNRISSFAVNDSLAVIWAYCQFLQIKGFRFPEEIEVPNSFLHLKPPQQWISEWELELLAKEIILNGNLVASKGRTLRAWKNLSGLVNELKSLENLIYGEFGSQEKILVELVRVAHRQFIWQANRPNTASTIRYFKIFNRKAIDEICREKIGLSIWETYMCGVASMGFFLDRPAIAIPFKSEIKALPVDAFARFFAFTSKSISELRSQLKTEQRYDETFSYAYNSLRAFPLLRMTYQGSEALVCPLMTLLYWRFTSGLYYEFISVPQFANEFGEGFQNYVGEVIERACPDPMQRLDEQLYVVGKSEKRTVDWIVSDANSALFLECKAKRISWGAKAALTDLGLLETDIAYMATAVVQIYKTILDYRNNAYSHFPDKKGRKIFPAVITLENWRIFGPVMINKLADAVTLKLNEAAIPPILVEEMPYSIWAIEDLEVGLQIMNANGIASFMEGKLRDPEKRQWDWHGYMTNSYRKSFPAKKLFEKEYDEMFSNLFQQQSTS
jgi:hypothetical protein